jgi:hypothetical protein
VGSGLVQLLLDMMLLMQINVCKWNVHATMKRVCTQESVGEGGGRDGQPKRKPFWLQKKSFNQKRVGKDGENRKFKIFTFFSKQKKLSEPFFTRLGKYVFKINNFYFLKIHVGFFFTTVYS